jgi:phage baseplate assembly protein gpV
MTGTGKTIATGQATIVPPASLNFGAAKLDRTFENRGTAIWSSGSFYISANGVLINASGALFEAQAHAGLSGDSFGTGLFRNDGTVRKTGTSTRSVVWLPFAGNGTVEVLGGTFQLSGTQANTMRFTGAPGGILELRGNGPSAPTIKAPGSRIETPNVKLSGHTTIIRGSYNMSGSTTIEGLATFDTNAQIANLGATTTITYAGDVSFNTGTPVLMHDLVMNPAANLRATSDITVEGSLTWRGGAMYGPGTTTVRGGMALGGITSYTNNPHDYTQELVGRTLVNQAAATCDDCLIYADQGAVLQNTSSGTFRVTRNAAFARCTVSYFVEGTKVLYECVQQGAPPVFRNEGRLVVAGPGTLYFTAVPGVPAPLYIRAARPYPAQLINSGTVQIESGSLNAAGGYAQTGGVLELHDRPIVGSTFDIQSGSLSGTGTITGTVINAGTVQPGGSGTLGTLAIGGSYRQMASGRLELELGGSVIDQIDRLRVSGLATLGGVLAVSAINGFVPASGNSFGVLAYGTRSGVFAAVNGGSTSCIPEYSTNETRLVVP